VSGHMRKLLVAFSAFGLLMQASPALASGPLEPLAHARIRSVRLLENGRVRVAARYVCSSPDKHVMSLSISQQTLQGISLYSRPFRPRANCDGTEHKVVRRARLLHRQPINPRLPLSVTFNGVGAADWVGYFVFEDGHATRVADTIIAETRLNQHNEVVVAISYKCPTGWAVNDGDVEQAQLEVDTYGPHYLGTYWVTLVGSIACDGSADTVVRRFGPDEDWRSGTLLVMRVYMDVLGPEGGAILYESRTVQIG